LDPANSHATTAGKSNYNLIAGKKVGVLPGTYNIGGYVDTTVVNDTNPILNIPGGNPYANTVIQSTTPRGALFDGANTIGGGAGQYAPCIGSSDTRAPNGYVTIDGFEIQNFNGGGVNCWHVTGTGNCLLIQNNHIHGISTTVQGGNPGHIRGQSWFNATITNNKIHDYGSNVETNNGALGGIVFYYGALVTVSYNYVYNVQSGIHGKGSGGSNDNHGCTVCYNWVEALQGESTGIKDFSSTFSGYTSYFHHNVVNANNPFVHGGVGSTHSLDSQATVCYNNSFYFNGGDGGGGFCYIGTTVSGGINFYNNVLQLTGVTNGFIGEFAIVNGTLGLSDYNCYTASASSVACLAAGSSAVWTSSPTLYTLSGWQTLNGTDAHSIAADNVLNSPTTGTLSSYQPASGSAILNAGRVGGTSAGVLINMGAFDGTGTPGCNF
jgi:hypothetical protein